MTKSDLFEDVAVAMDYWTAAASNALTESKADLMWVEEQAPYQRIQRALSEAGVVEEDLKKVFAECLRGFAVSIFTALDGGTALAAKGRVYLTDENGKRLGEGLHDEFVSHLLNSERLQ